MLEKGEKICVGSTLWTTSFWKDDDGESVAFVPELDIFDSLLDFVVVIATLTADAAESRGKTGLASFCG